MSNNNMAKEKFDEGMADFVRHNYGRSIDLLSQAIELDPQFTLALKSRGAAYLKLDKIKEAMADINAVIDIAPDNFKGKEIIYFISPPPGLPRQGGGV